MPTKEQGTRAQEIVDEANDIATQVRDEWKSELDSDDPNGPDITDSMVEAILLRAAHLTADAIRQRNSPGPKIDVV